ncbi:MAG: efflux RND transporter periplasmic adaptor subunit [Gammaproteobacteria bacterium]|nr:efflux RND transporter periplasmic adaptor subunit [Gammaproteobacteria bacterium]
MLKILRQGFILLLLIVTAACQREAENSYQGYVEGRYTYIATSVPGRLLELAVARGTQVKRGQLLFKLESEPESDAYLAAGESLQENLAALNAIKANLEYAKITYERYKVLVPQGAIQQAQLDNAKSIYNANLAQVDQAKASVASARANLAQAKWRLEQKQLISPVDAIVFDTFYRVGEYTEENKAILSLLAPADIKVVFYVPEPLLGKLQLNNPIHVSCDGCKNVRAGRISFISPVAEFTPPVIYSIETNVKLIYRIEAAFSPQDAYQLHPGQPVYVSLGSGNKK